MNQVGTIIDFEKLVPSDLHRFSNAEFESFLQQYWSLIQLDRKEMALVHYQPVSEATDPFHLSKARVRSIFGGNGSGKTESAFVDMIMCGTGVIPDYLRRKYPNHDWSDKLRGPIQARVVCESLTTVLHPILLPKLKWSHWTGVDEPGGQRGHWGWVPKNCLIEGDWSRSWNEKTRLLRMYYRHPDNPDEILGESQIQFMSKDQDPSDFASGDLHYVLLDEPPSLPIWRENEARTMRVRGKIVLAMTWPDDPSINVDWLHDEVYERSLAGSPHKRDDYECFEIHTTQNQHLDQSSVQAQMAAWSQRERRVRIYGQHVRFSNRVHELFTDTRRDWCFECGWDQVVLDGRCMECEGDNVTAYCHVQDFIWEPTWPVIQVIDPHPRKPHMCAFIGVTPFGELWQIAELESSRDPAGLREDSEDLCAELEMRVVRRLIDPRMARNPSGTDRDRTWGDEFDAAGLYCDPADPSDVGRGLFDKALEPDESTRMPRVKIHPRCVQTIYQLKRFMWDDWRQGMDKAQKQRVKEKYDDYPACWRYMMNDAIDFETLQAQRIGATRVQTNFRRYPGRTGAR